MKKIIAIIMVITILLSFAGCGSTNTTKNVYNDIEELYKMVENYSAFVLMAWDDGFTSNDTNDSCFFPLERSADHPEQDAIDMQLIAIYTGKSVREVREYILNRFGATNYKAQIGICNTLFSIKLSNSSIPGFVETNIGIVDLFCEGLYVYSDMDNKLKVAESGLRNLPAKDKDFVLQALEVLNNIKNIREICDEIIVFCRDANRSSEAQRSNFNTISNQIDEYMSDIEDALYLLSYQAN